MKKSVSYLFDHNYKLMSGDVCHVDVIGGQFRKDTIDEQDLSLIMRTHKFYHARRKNHKLFAWTTMFDSPVVLDVGTGYHSGTCGRVQAIRHNDGFAVLVDFVDEDGTQLTPVCAGIRTIYRLSPSENIADVFDNHCAIFSPDRVVPVEDTKDVTLESYAWVPSNRTPNFAKLSPVFKFLHESATVHPSIVAYEKELAIMRESFDNEYSIRTNASRSKLSQCVLQKINEAELECIERKATIAKLVREINEMTSANSLSNISCREMLIEIRCGARAGV